MPAKARLRRNPAKHGEGVVFRALADPTRRELLLLLASQELTAGDLAQRFSISRPAVSKHLAVLRRAGLVRERRAGRERHYSLEQEPLREVLAYVADVERFWAARLKALGEHLDRDRDAGA